MSLASSLSLDASFFDLPLFLDEEEALNAILFFFLSSSSFLSFLSTSSLYTRYVSCVMTSPSTWLGVISFNSPLMMINLNVLNLGGRHIKNQWETSSLLIFSPKDFKSLTITCNLWNISEMLSPSFILKLVNLSLRMYNLALFTIVVPSYVSSNLFYTSLAWSRSLICSNTFESMTL
jgi:hypothetical protein